MMSAWKPPIAAVGRWDPLALWAIAAVSIAALAVLFYQGLVFLTREWASPEYSHGMLIPIISLAIVWLKRSELTATADKRGSWIGILVLTGSLVLATIGKLATIYFIVHVAIVFSVIGLAISLMGWATMRVLWFPLLYLFFMIPLPDFLLVQLSAHMQLLSTHLGVSIIRAFGIVVFVDGNVIDLGEFKMQVVEACSGLRYMFPLMSFGFLIGYLYNGPLWQRLLVFLSTIPITLFLNSLRIALIGIFYDFYGIDVANGLLHDFQGWAIFIVCLALLLIELRVLSLLVRNRPRFVDMFSVSSVRSNRTSARRVA